MPDIEPFSFASREGASEADVADFQGACSGRRHPCVVLSSPSACVSCAVHHIQETRRTVESWCQQTDQDQHWEQTASRFQDGASESVVSVQLSVEGVAISTRENFTSWSLLRKLNDVLGEVVHLVERLESDRQYAEEALGKERKRRRFLQSKLDNMSQWRHREHAGAVQREREAGLLEATQLKTQLKVGREKADEVHDKLLYAESLNQHVQEEINFAKKQIPIVMENLKLETSRISQTNEAIAQAEDVSRETQRDLRCAEEHLREIEVEVNKEKTSTHNFLLAKKSQQAKKLEDLKQLNLLDENLCAECKEAEGCVSVTEEKCAAMSRLIPQMMDCENAEKDSISLLNLHIEEEIHKNKKLKEKLNLLQEDIEKSRLKGETHNCRTDEQLQCRRRVHAALRLENMQLKQNVDDHLSRIGQSETSVRLLSDKHKQMVEKTSDNLQQFENAEQEKTRVAAQHRLTSEQLDQQQRAADHQEHKIRTHIESLRNDLSGQVSSQQLLKAQCVSLHEKVSQQQRNFVVTNQQLLLELEDTRSVSEALHSEVKELKTLRGKLTTLQSEHRKTVVLLQSQERLGHDGLQAAQGSQCELMKRQKDSERCITAFLEKTEEYHQTSDKVEQSIGETPEHVKELQNNLDVLECKTRSAVLMNELVQFQVHEGKLQTRHLEQMFTAQDDLKAAVKENNSLAWNYRSVTNILEKVKQQSVTALSWRSRAHQSFLYFSQLLELQARIHEALVSNLKRRGLNMWTELERCFAVPAQKE